MKYLTRKLIAPTVLVVSILMVGVLTTSIVSAQDAAFPTIVERLASKFNLNKDEVQQVFAEVADEHRADMFAKWAERLDDLVAGGKLTDVQKELILDKHEEMEAKFESLKNQDLTREERKIQIGQIHEEMKKWADENNIDVPFMMFMGKPGGPGGHEFKGEFFTRRLD